MDTDSALRELHEDPSSRKRFLKAVGGGGAFAALSVLVAACGGNDKKTAATTAAAAASSGKGGAKPDFTNDIDIVNYALTLEYLETQFYNDVITSGVIKDPKVGSLAKEIAAAEQQHVDALTAAVKQLGGTPAAKPMASFQSVIDGGPMKILQTAATVENLGAAAYLGQAGNIKSKEILGAALAIHSVEARHAAAINALVGRGFAGSDQLTGSLPDGAFARPMKKADVLAAVKPFLTA